MSFESNEDYKLIEHLDSLAMYEFAVVSVDNGLEAESDVKRRIVFKTYSTNASNSVASSTLLYIGIAALLGIVVLSLSIFVVYRVKQKRCGIYRARSSIVQNSTSSPASRFKEYLVP